MSTREPGVAATRVIGVYAHIDAGKTTTSEGILYTTGRIHRMGNVDQGNTQLDWMEQERERGITITSAATACTWRGHRINLIDTPGHIDFSAEVIRSIRVIDGAVIVLCGVGGVEPQTETVWRHAEGERLPRILFVNKLDRLGAALPQVLEQICDQLTPHAVALQLPIGREGDFRGIVDLLSRRALVWQQDAEEPVCEEIPPALEAEAEAARTRLLEAVCATDDALLAQWLEGREPEQAQIVAALRRATIRGTLVPVVCGSALRGIGIQPLLDAIVDYLPSPLDVPVPQRRILAGRIDPGDDALSWAAEVPFCAVAFKLVTDAYVGHLTWVRVFSGRRGVGEAIYNPRADIEERISRIFRIHANRREQVEGMSTGDVVALVGPRSAVTGDTLCDPGHFLRLEECRFPEPVITVALSPSSDEEMEKLLRAVDRLCTEDPTLVAHYDPETHEEILAGMGELHLEIAVDRLRSEFGLTPRVSPPQVAYRETVRRAAEATGSYIKQSGGSGHFAIVHLRVEPLARGAGVVFENAAPAPRGGGTQRHGRHAGIPISFARAVESGVRQALARGVYAGYPVTDIRVTILDGHSHEVDSAALDFQIAGSMAVRQALHEAQPMLLEPIMRVDVLVRQEHLGTVGADLGGRRGSVRAMQARGGESTITGEVPLAETHGYVSALRDYTHGRGTFTLEYLRQDPVPDAVARAIVARRQAEGRMPER